MSEQTRQAVEDALREHVADEADGAYLTDWVALAAAAIPADPNVTSYVTASSDGPLHIRLGLTDYLQRVADEAFRGRLNDD